MTHDNHEGLPGYDVHQIWIDGCAECEFRSRYLPGTLLALDSFTFVLAWQRATALNIGDTALADLGPMSAAEAPLLDLLWMMQVVLERQVGLPIGEMPRA